MQPIRERFFAHLERIFQDWNSLRKGSPSLDLSQDKDVKSLDLKMLKQVIGAFREMSDERLYKTLRTGCFTEAGLQFVCYVIASRIPLVEQKVKESVVDITRLLSKEAGKGLLSLEEQVHLLGNIVAWERLFKPIPDSCLELRRLAIA